MKVVLLNTYCICVYDAALWKCYNSGSLNRLLSCYNRCIELFFCGFEHQDSLTNILLLLWLPSFDTLLANTAVSFNNIWNACTNNIVCHAYFEIVIVISQFCVFSSMSSCSDVFYFLLSVCLCIYFLAVFLLFLWTTLSELKSNII